MKVVHVLHYSDMSALQPQGRHPKLLVLHLTDISEALITSSICSLLSLHHMWILRQDYRLKETRHIWRCRIPWISPPKWETHKCSKSITQMQTCCVNVLEYHAVLENADTIVMAKINKTPLRLKLKRHLFNNIFKWQLYVNTEWKHHNLSFNFQNKSRHKMCKQCQMEQI